MEEYFSHLQKRLEEAYAIAKEARSKNIDPEPEPEIIPTSDIATRVEGLVGPKGIADGIRALGLDRPHEIIAFEIAKEILDGKYGTGNKEKLIDQAVRTGVAILTEGVLVAPTEGIASIKVKQNPDGTDYLAMYYAGPIRAAGGTVAALSVVLADIARIRFGIKEYRPTDSELERYVEEINIYHVRGPRLQFKPADDEVRLIVRSCPVCIDGDPTEDFEVSVHRDLERIPSNRVRSGMCLVLCEGVAQKASKVLKYTKKVGVGWQWLESLVRVPKKEGSVEVKADDRFLEDIVAGRPIFAYPSEKGGFRLRYGRSRMTGIAAKAIHPAAMVLLDNFPAIGTQLKMERPGKGCVISPCDSIEGPVVKLKNGSVVQVKSVEEAEKIRNDVQKLLFLGDMLISYGDFYRTNHPLVPSAYCEEWWLKEVEKASKEKNANVVIEKSKQISAEEAFKIAQALEVPLHPKYTYFWHDIKSIQVKELAEWLVKGKLSYEWFKLKEYRVESSPAKEILEELCIPHNVEQQYIVLDAENAYALLTTLGILNNRALSLEFFLSVYLDSKETMELVNELAKVEIRKKAPTYIGARMGRPEKARERKMKPAPNILFPVGAHGGKIRSLLKAYRDSKSLEGKGTVIKISRMRCPACGELGIYSKCGKCGNRTFVERVCSKCNKVQSGERCFACNMPTIACDERPVDMSKLVDDALKRTGSHLPNDIKGVKGMTSETKIPEVIEKGILRAKHNVVLFKDGTCRFDATDMVLTHFYPKEVGASVEKLKELGYTKDYLGNELKGEDQLVELRIQDVLISNNGAEFLKNVANFIDDLLVYLYNLKPYYSLKSSNDLIGHMVITLSPHTSCGVLGRIVGFTKAHVGYAHPYMVSARRRNADGDEDSTMLLMDGLLNFSRKFLPESRGGTMDAPLILTKVIDPKEVDDEAHCMEVCTGYPLEFYEATLRFAPPSEIKIEKVDDRLGKESQYSGLMFTHESSSIDNAPVKTKYVELKTMKEKIDAQFSLGEKIRAVNIKDAAERLILSHFMPDLYGNLRSFSRQEFRCVDCNMKYRRVPLLGKCRKCGGKLLLTINKGGIEKYLKISQEIVDKYDLPIYLKQRLQLIERDIKSIFEDETSRQFNLAEFM